MSLLCSLKNISLSYGTKNIFNQTDFNIHIGDRIGLLGLNGKGKSSLLNILTGSITPDTSTPPFIFDRLKNNNQTKFSVFLIPQDFQEIPGVKVRDYYLEFYPQLKKLHQRLKEIEPLILEDDKYIYEQKENL